MLRMLSFNWLISSLIEPVASIRKSTSSCTGGRAGCTPSATSQFMSVASRVSVKVVDDCPLLTSTV